MLGPQTSGTLLASWPGQHKGRVYKLVELSRAALVVSAAEDMTVNVWSAASMSFVCAIRGDAQHSVMMRAMLAVRHDESTQAAAEQLWTSDATGKINVWELSTQTTAPSLVQSTSLTGGESICCMCQAPDTGMRSCRFEDSLCTTTELSVLLQHALAHSHTQAHVHIDTHSIVLFRCSSGLRRHASQARAADHACAASAQQGAPRQDLRSGVRC